MEDNLRHVVASYYYSFIETIAATQTGEISMENEVRNGKKEIREAKEY